MATVLWLVAWCDDDAVSPGDANQLQLAADSIGGSGGQGPCRPQTYDEIFCKCKENIFYDKLANDSGHANAKRKKL